VASETVPGARRPVQATRAGTTAAVVAVVFWGMGNVLVKHIALSGLSLAFNRLCLGALVYGGALYLTGGRLTLVSLRRAAAGGVAFGLDIALFFSALKQTSVADASIITALQPALVFLVAGRLFGERVTSRVVGWTTLATVGVAVAILGSASGAGRTTAGDLIATASLDAWTWYFVASRQAREQMSALEYQAALTTVAAIVVAPFALVSSHDLVVRDPATAGWVLLMVLVPGGGHLLMNWAHNYAPITLMSMLTLGIPVVATVGAAVLLGEPVSLVEAIGIVVVVVAIAMVLWRPHPRLPPVADALP
jgi:drug/metabolite transporter (DMT)-like permease